MIDLIRVQRELRVVKVYRGQGRIALGAFGDFRGLRVIHKDGQSAEDNSLDFEEVLRVNPDCASLAWSLENSRVHTFV